MAEGLAELPGPHPGQAQGGQRAHLVEAQLEELAVGDGVDVRVVGAGAVPGEQEGNGLVQVVHDRRVVLVEHAVHGPGGLVHLLVGVAVDVHERVLRPVGRRLSGQAVEVGLALQEAVEPLHHAVAPVGVRDGVDEHHDLLADGPDHRPLRHGQAVRQLQHGLGAARLVGVQDRVQVVDGPRGGDDRLGFLGARAARIGEGCGLRLQPVEIADAGLVGDGDHQDLAAFFALADGEDAHSGRGVGEGAAVGVGLRRVHELARRPGDATQEAQGRGHDGRRGQVRHPGREEARLGGGLADGLDGAGLGGVGSDVVAGRRRGHDQAERGHDGAGHERASGSRPTARGSAHEPTVSRGGTSLLCLRPWLSGLSGTSP